MSGKQDMVFNLETFLRKVDHGKSIQGIQDKQVIFSQGDAADSAFYILKGRVKLTPVSKGGREAVIAILDAGHFFGEASLMVGRPTYVTTATAFGNATVVRLKKETMLRLLRAEPEFANLFIAHLVNLNNRVQEDLIDRLFNSTEKRLARVLLLLADFGQKGDGQTVIPRVSQETLGQMIGADRSRVSSFMNRFKKLGYVEYSGSDMCVRSSLLNVVLRQ
ncbi:MAG: Crp/Fnr family transcriptional regulator [Terriglobia bacterium]